MSKKICVLGSANADFFVYVNKIPEPGQTIQSLKQLHANGGKGANQAVAAGRLAGHSLFLGQVGNDTEKKRLQKQMTQSGVQLGWIVKQNVSTGKAIIFLDKTGQNSIVIIGGANINYESLQQLPEFYKKGIQSSDYLLLQKEIPMKINILAAAYAKKLNKTVMLDCGGSDQQITDDILKNLDFISPNTSQLLRIDNSIDSSNIVQEIRTKILSKYQSLIFVLKMGSKGSRVISKDLDVYLDVITHLNKQVLENYKIIDTVGAGDCFTAAFIVKHSQLNWESNIENNYRDCLMFGNVSAFLCITKSGAMPSLPYKSQVEEFYKKYVN